MCFPTLKNRSIRSQPLRSPHRFVTGFNFVFVKIRFLWTSSSCYYYYYDLEKHFGLITYLDAVLLLTIWLTRPNTPRSKRFFVLIIPIPTHLPATTWIIDSSMKTITTNPVKLLVFCLFNNEFTLLFNKPTSVNSKTSRSVSVLRTCGFSESFNICQRRVHYVCFTNVFINLKRWVNVNSIISHHHRCVGTLI